MVTGENSTKKVTGGCKLSVEKKQKKQQYFCSDFWLPSFFDEFQLVNRKPDSKLEHAIVYIFCGLMFLGLCYKLMTDNSAV